VFFLNTIIRGSRLPPKTLSLTFDDGPGTTASASGPGPRTDELGHFLFAKGIPATFFVIGNRAARHRELLSRLVQWGHLVANHGHDHTAVDALPGRRVVDDVLRCAAAIGDASNPESLLFRPPLGAWSPEAARTLNLDPETRRYIGPIGWDIDGRDWEAWHQQQTVEHCADRYFEAIRAKGSGIVLLHDNTTERNNTYEMTRLLVPRLVKDGYRFVRLDGVPQVRSAMRVKASVALADPSSGLYASARNGGGGPIFFVAKAIDAWEEFGIVPLDHGDVALRTSSGQFVCVCNDGDGGTLANGEQPDESGRFTISPVTGSVVTLTSARGNRLSISGNLLTAGGAAKQFTLLQRA